MPGGGGCRANLRESVYARRSHGLRRRDTLRAVVPSRQAPEREPRGGAAWSAGGAGAARCRVPAKSCRTLALHVEAACADRGACRGRGAVGFAGWALLGAVLLDAADAVCAPQR